MPLLWDCLTARLTIPRGTGDSDPDSDDGTELREWMGTWPKVLSNFDTLCSQLRRRQIVGSAATARITVEFLRTVVRHRMCLWKPWERVIGCAFVAHEAEEKPGFSPHQCTRHTAVLRVGAAPVIAPLTPCTRHTARASRSGRTRQRVHCGDD